MITSFRKETFSVLRKRPLNIQCSSEETSNQIQKRTADDMRMRSRRRKTRKILAPVNSKTFLKAAGYNPLRREGLMKRETKERKEFACFDKKYRQLFISAVYFHVTKFHVL